MARQTAPEAATGPHTDGRTLRARRTRNAVIDAICALIEEGDLRPTADRIAARAGVSPRTVFQHFDDMESLVVEAAERELVRAAAMLREVPPGAPLDERIRAWTAQRTAIYEAMAPVRRAAALAEPFSPSLAGILDGVRALSREELRTVFGAELEARGDGGDDLLLGLDAATSWDAWEHLRRGRGLDPARAERVLAGVVRRLLG